MDAQERIDADARRRRVRPAPRPGPDLPRLPRRVREHGVLEEYDADLAASLRADMNSGATADHVRRVMGQHLHNDNMAQWLCRTALYLESLKAQEAT